MNERLPQTNKVSVKLEVPHSSIGSNPYSIPVLIDDVKHLDEFHMTRCTFFMIEAMRMFDDWVTLLRDRDIPFLLLGMSPVIYRPDLKNELFTSSVSIDSLFKQIEDIEGLVVETSHMWLPNFLFYEMREEEDPSEIEKLRVDRGSLWRVGFNLFKMALQFQLEIISAEQFSKQCRVQMESEGNQVAFSKEETDIFREWSLKQIDIARSHYVEQRDDSELGVLKWRDKLDAIREG